MTGVVPFVRLGESLPSGFSRDRVRSATEVRASVIISSRLMVRELGFFDRYEAELIPADRATLDALVVDWVPVALLRAHYSALDRLRLPVETQLQLGRGLSNRMHKPVFDTAIRLAGALGVTPWTIAEQAVKMFGRAYNGGELLVQQRGPKEARFEVLGFPCADLDYCRNAWRGIVLGATELFATSAYVNELPAQGGVDRLAYRVSWV
jgi:hypothetical protein